MKDIRCDVAVIGAGTAGLTAAKAAAAEGATTCVIEPGPKGTTCARVGCMPSKLLIVAAQTAETIRGAHLFGIEAPAPRVDGPAVMARVRRERDHFVDGVVKGMEENPPDHYVTGNARFAGPRTLMVDDHTRVEAKAVIIATGAEVSVPEAFQNLGDRLLTNETVFEMDDLPGSLAVIGLGPLGLELGQALDGLGVRVVLFDRGEGIGGLSDDGVNSAARSIFEGKMDLRLNVETEAERVGDDVCIRWKAKDGRSGEETFERVLVAAGRRPALDGLDLEKAGIDLDEHGTPVFDPDTLRCGKSAIFIAGDANHDRPVLHEAAVEGRIAGQNAARYPAVERRPRQVKMAVVFSDPQIAFLGTGEAGGPGIAQGSVDFADQGRAKVMGKNAGLLHVYGDRRTGRVVGAQMVCPGAEHFAHLIAWAVDAGLSVRTMIDLPYYHPTLEEGLRSAFRDLCREMGVAPAMGVPSLEYGPGG